MVTETPGPGWGGGETQVAATELQWRVVYALLAVEGDSRFTPLASMYLRIGSYTSDLLQRHTT